MVKRQTIGDTSAPSISPEERAELKRSGGSASHAWNSEIVMSDPSRRFRGRIALDVDDHGQATGPRSQWRRRREPRWRLLRRPVKSRE